jgi:type IV pilus assembly protein PilA
MRKQKGFTLIELMIVVAIIAIIAAIAIEAWKDNRETNMATSGGTLADAPVSYLVCKDSGGVETRREPAIPGQRWEFSGGAYVTYDANGNPRTVNSAGTDCTIES